MERKNNQKRKEFWLLSSTILNLIMAAGKIFIGSITSTPVITADGIHSISDIASSVLIYASIKLSGKKTKKFPLGMHKLEDLAALLGSIAIFYAGYQIIKGVILKPNPSHPTYISISIPFLILVLIAQSLFAFFELKSAKKLNSPGVKTDLINWLGDIGTTIIAILGVTLSFYKVPYAQQITVAIIVLAIYREAFEIVKDAILTLLDASVEPSIIEKAKKIISSHPKIESTDLLFIRKAGSIFIADIVLRIDEKSMSKAHQIVEEIEKDLKKAIKHLKIVTIHYEPAKKTTKKIALLLDKNHKIATRLRDVAKIKINEINQQKEIISSLEHDNPFYENGRGHSIRLISWLIKNDIDELIFNPRAGNLDRIELFENLGIKIKNSTNL